MAHPRLLTPPHHSTGALSLAPCGRFDGRPQGPHSSSSQDACQVGLGRLLAQGSLSARRKEARGYVTIVSSLGWSGVLDIRFHWLLIDRALGHFIQARTREEVRRLKIPQDLGLPGQAASYRHTEAACCCRRGLQARRWRKEASGTSG